MAVIINHQNLRSRSNQNDLQKKSLKSILEIQRKSLNIFSLETRKK